MREHHGIDIDVRGYENEIIRRTENPKWTDAQNLKRKVLQRRKSKPAKKKVCAQKVGDVFNELLAQEFHNVLECDSLSIAKISALIEYSKKVLEELLKEKLKTIWIEFFKKSASDFLYEENVFFFTEVCLALQISLPDSERDEFLAYLSEHSVKDLPKQMEATTSTDQSPCCSHSFENGELDLKELDDSELFEMLSTATGIQADNLLRNDLAKFQKDVSTKICAHYLKPIFGASLDIDRLETELKIELRAVNGFSSQTKGRSDSSVVAQNNDLSQNRPNWKELLVKRFTGKLAKHLQEDR
ncbi:unnamed protein product, partial [Mesorhabditis belari]|uniref:Uncharacterized protein n=1 Tax=Mesorhabditis belari TaxID=2138241 RepID=A0AAF3FBT3_9BILA